MTDTLTKGKIFKDDTQGWDGVSTTGTRKTSTGGSQTLNRFDWVGVDALAVYGAVNGRARQTIVDAQSAIGGTNLASIFLSPGTWTIDASLTINSNVVLIIPPGAKLSVASGQTLTINGMVSALDYEIFTGSGSLDLTSYSGPFIFPTWGLSAASYITINGTVASLTANGNGSFGGTLTVTGNVDFNGNEDLAGTLDIGAGTTRRVAPAGTFGTVATGNPQVSDTVYDLDGGVTESAWESIGPTGSGADNTWTALDSVPADADWVELRIYGYASSSSDTAELQRRIVVYMRETGSTEAADAVNNVALTQDCIDAAGNGDSGFSVTHKIPIDTSRRFDAYWNCTFNSSVSISLYLIGWGFNP